MTAPKQAKKPKSPQPQLVTPQIAAVLRCREILAETVAWAAESDQNYKGSKPPRYTQDCLYLLDHPEHISHPAMTPVIIKILQKFVADNPPRIPSSKEIAFMVDFWVNDGKGMSFELARRFVVESTGKTLNAVKKAHARYGNTREA
jgi:hypothetical protein